MRSLLVVRMTRLTVLNLRKGRGGLSPLPALRKPTDTLRPTASGAITAFADIYHFQDKRAPRSTLVARCACCPTLASPLPALLLFVILLSPIAYALLSPVTTAWTASTSSGMEASFRPATLILPVSSM